MSVSCSLQKTSLEDQLDSLDVVSLSSYYTLDDEQQIFFFFNIVLVSEDISVRKYPSTWLLDTLLDDELNLFLNSIPKSLKYITFFLSFLRNSEMHL